MGREFTALDMMAFDILDLILPAEIWEITALCCNTDKVKTNNGIATSWLLLSDYVIHCYSQSRMYINCVYIMIRILFGMMLFNMLSVTTTTTQHQHQKQQQQSCT